MIKLNNKKGASLVGWSSGAIGIILFMLCISIIILNMNTQYGKSYDSTFGMSSQATKAQLETYQGQLKSATEGEASTNALAGVNVVGSWGAVKGGLFIMWDFLNGQWIRNSVALLQFGEAGDALGWALSLLYIFSIGFIFIKLIFKIRP